MRRRTMLASLIALGIGAPVGPHLPPGLRTLRQGDDAVGA
jgi:hypothetical protein